MGYGRFTGADCAQAFAWKIGDPAPTSLVPSAGCVSGIPGGDFYRSAATAVSQGGLVVGWVRNLDGTIDAFTWRNGHLTNIGRLGDLASQPSSVNDHGDIVGTFYEPGGRFPVAAPFFYDGRRYWDLRQLVPSDIGLPSGINERGQIVSGDKLLTPGH